MDGTIIDTEPYWMAEELALVAEAGGTWSEADALDLVGNDLITSATIILSRTPVQGTPTEVVHRLLAGVIRRTREHLPWRPGAQELLAELSDLGVPMALVTMSWTQFADVLLEVLPDGTFSAVVTGDQVERGKPAPDPYLVAAAQLGRRPQDCLAIEDSPTGVASSTSAGVPTIAVPHMVSIGEVPGSVEVPTLEGVRAGDLLRLVDPAVSPPRRLPG
jgi:HAD superfamily hydrolase (TIGR01509 family)